MLTFLSAYPTMGAVTIFKSGKEKRGEKKEEERDTINTVRRPQQDVLVIAHSTPVSIQKGINLLLS